MSGFLVFCFFVLGTMCASFAGVIAERLNTRTKWLKGRSHCNSCNCTLGVLDLIPILSWLLSSGRCRTCGARISVSYTITEAVLGVLFALSYVTHGLTMALFVFLVALTILAAIVLYDLRHTVVPELLSNLLGMCCFVYALLTTHHPIVLGWTLLIAGIIGGLFLALHVCSSGRAMGLGDAPIALSLALLVGTQAVSGLLFSFWIGAVVGIIILCTRRGGPRMGIEVPFVPYLAAGFLLAYFSGWNPFSLFLM